MHTIHLEQKNALDIFWVDLIKFYYTKRLNIQTKNRYYKQVVREYLSKVSGAPIKEDTEVPIFFVDCYPDEVLFT